VKLRVSTSFFAIDKVYCVDIVSAADDVASGGSGSLVCS